MDEQKIHFLNRLKSRSGVAARDIVQFVPFREYATVSVFWQN